MSFAAKGKKSQLHFSHAKLPENTRKQKETLSFPLIAHYLSAGPPPPHTPLHRETRPHPHLPIILCFSAQQAGRAFGRSHLLRFFALKAYKLPVFIDFINIQ